jgi:transketolase
VEKARSGHPGLPMGAAPAAFALWSRFLKANPKDQKWADRDRFILSAGHGSAMLYALLHMFGYGVTSDDLRNFRQAGSLTPGHPEYGHTPGVEVTTGPLGQGFANGVGMAWAEKYLAARFNKPDITVVNHRTYVLCGDGCMMEGISAEAASLAGTLELGKLTVIYDSNNITIEGSTSIAFRENVARRFEAYGWNVILVSYDDYDGIVSAVAQAGKQDARPTLIEVKSYIGAGAPNRQNTPSAHGEPLGAAEIAAAKEAANWNYDEEFYVPDEVAAHIGAIIAKNSEAQKRWQETILAYARNYPADYREWLAWQSGETPDLLDNEDFWTYGGSPATRVSSEQVLNKAAKYVPNLTGGSADLAPSTKTIMKGRGDFSAENPVGSNLHFGIREHAMTAIANGMALHGGLRPYVAGFFVFSDYMKPAMRLSALMKLPVIYIMTHDSIGVGEDGPTHQPIEHLAALRSIPDFTVVRPADTQETAAGWYLALTRKSPTALVLSRQNLPALGISGKEALKGAYAVRGDMGETPDIILMATGSEVQLIVEAADELAKTGVKARAVSMPSWEVFEEQPEEYKEALLPKACRKRLAVEAACDFGWHNSLGMDGDLLCINTFGASGPSDRIFEQFGFTTDNVLRKANDLLQK